MEPEYAIWYRESDRLIAEAFDLDVPLVAWAELGPRIEPERLHLDFTIPAPPTD